MIKLTTLDAGHLQVELPEDFTFQAHKSFESTIHEALAQHPRQLTLQLQDVKYIDSSALGMLMLTIEQCHQQNCLFTLSGATGYVAEVISMVELDRLNAPLSEAPQA